MTFCVIMAKKILLPPENQRLIEFRRSFNKDQKEISYVLGISRAGVSNIETGRAKLTESNINRLCREYNLNPDWIKHGAEPMFLEEPEVKKSLIPVIADIPAGSWEYWIDSYNPDAEEDWFAAPGVFGRKLFGIRVKGDSMEPILYEGDILIIDPHKKFQRGIAVVRHKEGYKIRNVRKKGKYTFLLMPINQAYEDEEISLDEETRLYVPVKVVSFRDI